MPMVKKAVASELSLEAQKDVAAGLADAKAGNLVAPKEDFSKYIPKSSGGRDFEAEARGKTYSQQYAAVLQGIYTAMGMVLNSDGVADEKIQKMVALVDKVADAQASLVVARLFGAK